MGRIGLGLLDTHNWNIEMHEHLFQKIERRGAEMKRDPTDGLPVFEDLSVSQSASLSQTERLVLGQIEVFGGDWSLNSARRIYRDLASSFARERASSEVGGMGEERNLDEFEVALTLLHEKGLVEQVPGQEDLSAFSPDIRWQRVT